MRQHREALAALLRARLECVMTRHSSAWSIYAANRDSVPRPTAPDTSRAGLVWTMRDFDQKQRDQRQSCSLKVKAGGRC